jgi:hypothetical protein
MKRTNQNLEKLMCIIPNIRWIQVINAKNNGAKANCITLLKKEVRWSYF